MGPQGSDEGVESKLVEAVFSAFCCADERGWFSLSFPAISSGIFAVPAEICARAYCEAVASFFEQRPDTSLKEIRLCLFRGPLVDIIVTEFKRRFPG